MKFKKFLNILNIKKQNSEDKLKENLKVRVEEASTMANYIYEKI